MGEPLVKTSFTYKITKEIYEQNNLLEEKYLEKIGKHKEEHPEIEFTKDYLLTSLLKTRNKQQHLVDERNEAIKQNETLKEEMKTLNLANFALTDEKNTNEVIINDLKLSNNK